MSTPVMASEQDLRTLAGIVTDLRADLPEDGLPESLLRDLMDQIRCDVVSFQGFDSGRQECWFNQSIPDDADEYDDTEIEALDQAHWEHYWDSTACSYPDRTGDLRSVLTVADFHSARQWHATGMYTDVYQPQGFEHELQLCLPEPPGRATGPGRTVRLYLFRGPGLDFSERDRALLTLLRPHLHQAYLDAERSRHPVRQLTPRQTDLLRLLAAGHTNAQIARRLGLSEGTVRTHLENIYGRLQVSSRTAAVTRAFPDLVASLRMTVRPECLPHHQRSAPMTTRWSSSFTTEGQSAASYLPLQN
jgi:DNA-binding CsgD family transcriptional regulator